MPPIRRLLPRAAAALTLAACLACGSGDSASSGPPDGAKLFVLQNCITCHKHDGAGGPLGPPLRKLASHWTREEIAEYLSDPKAKLETDGRMKSLSLNFRMTMPPIKVDLEQRLLLADYVLALSAAH